MIGSDHHVDPMRRPRFVAALLNRRQSIVDYAILFGIFLFLLDYFEPKYLLSETITTGGDTGSHYYTAEYLRNHLLPKGRISGWTQGNYAGFPILQFYFPLPFLLMVALSYLIPLQVAFKLVSVLGLFLLPGFTYLCLRLMRLAFPIPIMGAVFTLPFLFMEANSMWGGNIPSTLAGEIAYSFGFSQTILLFGLLYSDIEKRKHALRHAVVVFFIGFSHGYTLLFAGLVSSYFLWTTQDFLKKFIYLFKIYLLGFFLLGFWIIPLLSYLPFTTAYNFLWVFNSASEIFPEILLPFLGVAAVGLVFELYCWLKSKSTQMAFWFIGYWMLLSILCFFAAFKLGVVDIRFLPFLQISLFLLASISLGRLLARAQAKSLFAVLMLLVTAVWTDANTESIKSWIAWNYSGFETKTLWPQFARINQALKGTPSDPRVVFEHSDVHNSVGTTRAFESLPLFAGRSTLEGLYMQASPSAPFVFDIQSEISDEISCPFPNYACSRHNIDRSIKHLEMFNVGDYVAVSDLVKSELKQHPDFQLKASAPPYEVYTLKTNQNRYVVPLSYEPVFVQTKDWKSVSYQWFKDFANNDVHLVFPAGTKPDDLKPFKTVVDGQLPARLPRLPLAAAGEIKETVLDDEIIFDTPWVNRPHLIKVSYHPNWKVEGADKVYLASPSFMLVYPNQPHVRMYYGKSRPEHVGLVLSLIGLATLLLGLPVLRRIPVLGRMVAVLDTDVIFGWIRRTLYWPSIAAFFGRERNVLLAMVALFGCFFGLIVFNKGEDPQSLLRDGILLKDLKEFSEARGNFKRVLEKYPMAGVADQASYYHAITYYMEDDCAQTIPAFKQLISQYPESVWVPEAYYHIGLCHRKLHNETEAMKAFVYVAEQFGATDWAERARESMNEMPTDGDSGETLEQLNQAIARFNKDECGEVVALVGRMQDEDPEFPRMDEAVGLKALCLFKGKNFQESARTYQRMVKEFPKSRLLPEAYYHLGRSHQQLRRSDAARKAYNVVITRYPATDWAKRASQALAELR
jgi:TolA-binding protein